MNSQKVKKIRRGLIVLLVVGFPWLVAFQVGDGEGVSFTETQLALLSNFFLPVLAQIVKIYREKGGKKPSANVINWALFIVGVVMSVFWGHSISYLTAIAWPVLDFGDPAALFGSVFGFLNSIVMAGGTVAGIAVAYYLILKPLVFQFIPWFQTEEIKAAKIAAKISK